MPGGDVAQPPRGPGAAQQPRLLLQGTALQGEPASLTGITDTQILYPNGFNKFN